MLRRRQEIGKTFLYSFLISNNIFIGLVLETFTVDMLGMFYNKLNFNNL